MYNSGIAVAKIGIIQLTGVMMCAKSLLIAHVLIAAVFSCGCADIDQTQPPRTADESIRQLKALPATAEVRCGHPFAESLDVLLDKGDGKLYRQMLADDNVFVRIVAMECLVKKEGTASVPLLRSRLGGRTAVNFSIDCLGGTITEGAYARESLIQGHVTIPDDGSIFGSGEIPESFLTDEQRFALEMEMLARDDTAAMHRPNRLCSARPMIRAPIVDTDRDILPLPVLRRICASMPDLDIVKAAGRAQRETKLLNFLLACLADKSLDSNVRLAAASALTRYPKTQAKSAVEAACREFDKQPGKPGSIILQAYASPINDEWPLAAVTDELVDAASRTRALTELCERMEGWNQPWNTHSSLPFLAEFELRCWIMLDQGDLCCYEQYLSDLMEEEQITRLVDTVNKAIAARRLPADPSNPPIDRSKIRRRKDAGPQQPATMPQSE